MPANLASILVKRYARTRFYDTSRACYVSVEDLRRWRAGGVAFAVLDAENGEDVTRVVLA